MKENKGLKVFLTILTVISSIALAGFFFYLGLQKFFWFYPFAGVFATDALVNFFASLNKDKYKGMKALGGWQIFTVINLSAYMLVMILWNDPEKLFPNTLAFYVLGGFAVFKLITSIISGIATKVRYNPAIHAYRNSDIMTIFFLAALATIVVTNMFYPGTGTEGIFKEKPIWIYAIDLGSNIIYALFAGLLALSTLIRAKLREQLSTAGKIRHLFTWFKDNEVAMFFALIFTGYLASLAFMNVRTNPLFILLGIYYIVIAGIRLINFFWHHAIVKRSDGNMIRENRRSSWILFFNAFAYSLSSDAIAVGAIALMGSKMSTETNMYMFLFFIIPLAVIKFVLAIRGFINYRIQNDTYRMGLGLISFMTAMMSILEVVAITMHGVRSAFLRYSVVISSIVVVKSVVLVISIIFIVHWIRSLIVNRSSKDKEYEKAKHQ